MNEQGFKLNGIPGYLNCCGVDVFAFDEDTPALHQSGVTLVMNDVRVATNGDLRFEPTPGQWQPSAKRIDRRFDPENDAIVTTLHYPDDQRHLKGFNPAINLDFELNYTVAVRGEGDSVRVTVDLDRPVPEHFLGKLCFNLELFPGRLFGKPWIMDETQGLFPCQPNGPTLTKRSNHSHRMGDPEGVHADSDMLSGHGREYSPIVADDVIAEPYAVGQRFTARPDDAYSRFTVVSEGAELKLYDGRMNHNNGWFVLSSEVPAGATEGAISWLITPTVTPDYLYAPVVQTSQVGYLPNQPKRAFIELDRRDDNLFEALLYRITENGPRAVLRAATSEWGQFLRYRYLVFDFSDVREEGLYQVAYGHSQSCVFRIAADVYDRGVWQPVLEYFLPVQMCHMRVSEKYRLWHGLCHKDDARMAPVGYNHFDGYEQGASTLTKYQSGEHVPGLDAGGWHDAGDYDLRVESQAGEIYILTLAREEFGVDYDATTIDQTRKLVEIHQPDGKNDILQQIEHGLITLVGGYRALGRLYRGIICGDLRQYVLLGDGALMTDGIPGTEDDRWVFTEDNPKRELTVAAQLAAASRVMRGFNDVLGAQALEAAEEIFSVSDKSQTESAAFHAAAELFLTTGKDVYRIYLIEHDDIVTRNPEGIGWIAVRLIDALNDVGFTETVRSASEAALPWLQNILSTSPYGVPYPLRAWGNGWVTQSFACRYYYLHKAFPEMYPSEPITSALDFVLGCHPGANTASFASGVGAKSAIPAYGVNRADWSYIPGGVVSGTELIAPDFPEMLEFPFIWQQLEYVIGGGSSEFMFLTLAVKAIAGSNRKG